MFLAGCSKESLTENGSGKEQCPVCISINDGSTKATYDSSLKATWETGDKLAIVQASQKAEVGTISNSESAKSVFTGNTLVTSQSTKTFHFAYPSNALSISDAAVVTCTFTVETTQSGKWIPFLHTTLDATPSDLKSANIDFGATQGSALAVRVYDKSKEHGKNDIESISVSAVNNIAGTITDGTVSATANTIALGSTIEYTTGTSSDVTYYEYRFNILPVDDSGIITITLNDGKKTVTATTTKGTKFEANKRIGINVLWPADEATTSVTATFADATDGGWTDIIGAE